MVDEELEGTREQVRRLLNAANTDEIVFTAGTTMSLNLVANGWAARHLRAGDEILLSEMEHHANLVPWQQVAQRTGAVLQFIPLTADGRLDMERLGEVLSPKTRLLTTAGMSNVLGTINPLAELARRAHEVGAIFVVDGAQCVPHDPLDVVATGIDFLAFSSHKLYGPSGVGVLYGRRELLAETDPLLFGGHMIDRVYRDHSTWAMSPAKFEAGTIPIAQAIALRAAIDYVNSLGFTAMQAHERELLAYALERLAEVPGMHIYGPGIEHRGAIISFTIDGTHPEDLAQLLDRRGVFVRHGHHCTMPLHDRLGVPATVRASFGIYNTLAEVDALLEAIQFAREKLRVA